MADPIRLTPGVRQARVNRTIDVRLIVITDAQLARPRALHDIIREALEAGAPVVQLRDKNASARQLFEQAVQLRGLTSQFDALLFINDRLDVALAARADGLHLGPSDMPLAAARRVAPPPFLIGWSTDDPEQAELAVAAGADYIGCGAVFGTSSKDVAGERIGTDRLRQVINAVKVPVVGIGGIDTTNVGAVARAGAAGAAVIHAVMTSSDVPATVSTLLAAFES
jgi:thiamine-phosphate pyrophosphorylase